MRLRVVALLLLLATCADHADSEAGSLSIRFWKQSGYVYLPSDLQWPLSFTILNGDRVSSAAIVRVGMSTPYRLDGLQPTFSYFALPDVCNATALAGELQCLAVIDCLSVGVHHGFRATVQLRLEDGHGSAASEHEMSIWIRSILTPSNAEPPACWRPTEPLGLQDPDCVWLWLNFKPNLNVLLSSQDIGPPHKILTSVITGATSPHEGSWGDFVAYFTGSKTPDKNLLSCLPPVGFLHRTHQSCAVVGSAWHLDHSYFGAEIDAHEVVLRFNDPPLEGWESHVGSRTTHRMINGQQDLSQFNQSEQILFRVRTAATVEKFIDACQTRNVLPVALSPDWIEYVHSSFAGAVSRTQAFMMTTGFLGVMWALHSCQSVSVYGMGGGESEQENGMVQYNYYSWQPRDAHYFMPLHPWDDEAILLMRLEQAGALRRRFRDDLEETLQCATLGDTAALYGAAPHNLEAHARICPGHRGAATEDDQDRPSERELEMNPDGTLEAMASGAANTTSAPRAKIGGRGLEGTELDDFLYQSTYRVHKSLRRQEMILHDLLMCGGADPPLQVDGVRPAVVLDAGAGMGAVVQWLRDTQKVMEVEAHGVELSGVAVESSPWPELTQLQLLRQGSLDHLPFPDRTFDLVFSHEVLEHVPTTNVPRVLQELVRGMPGPLAVEPGADNADVMNVRVVRVRVAGQHTRANMVTSAISVTSCFRQFLVDDPAAPHLHVTVQPRGWWDERMADEGCVPDLDLLGFMWRDPAAKHDDHRQWMPYRDPWMFAYKCAVGGDAAAAEAEAHAELQAMRRIPEGCAQHAAAAQSEQLGEMEGCSADGWADVFDPAVYWATDAAKPKETMHKQYLAFLADRFGMVLGSDV